MSQVQHDSYQMWLCSALVMYMFQTVTKSLGARALTQVQTMTAAEGEEFNHLSEAMSLQSGAH